MSYFNRLKFRYPVEKPWKVPMPNKASIEEYEGRREVAQRMSGKEGLEKFDGIHLGWFADGLFYNDLREPFISAIQPVATLLTTATMLYSASAFPVLGGQYFSRLGKKLKVRVFGQMTTDGTAGNGSFSVYYGTGASANGTILHPVTTPVAMVTSATAKPWQAEIYVHCRATGSTGTLFVTGSAIFGVNLLLSTNAPILIPDVTPVVSGSIDLTAANIIALQYMRSGAGVWTMYIHDMEVTALN
jgi:hypothetical protein